MIRKILFAGAFVSSFVLQAQESEDFKPVEGSTPKITLIPSVGYAWRTAKTADGLTQNQKDYVKGIKKGMTFDFSAYYNIKQNWGLGLKFSYFSASTEGNLTFPDPNTGYNVTGYSSSKDNITFIGPAFMFSNFNEATRHKFYYDLGLGVVTYTTKSGNVKGTGSNLGLDANIAYQYAITNQIFVGPKLGYTVGTLTKMKFNGQTVDLGENKEGLGRVNLSLAATFRF